MKKKTIQKIEFLNMGCYPGTILFSYQFSYDELMAEINHQYKIKRWKEVGGTTHWSAAIESDKALIDNGSYFALKRELYNSKTGEEKTLFYIILKKKFEFNDWDYCMLAHEVLHICQFFLPDILNRDKETEAEAYLHTHIMSQCLKVLRSAQ